MKTGERVKLARKFLKMTQEAFGEVAGVSKAAVSYWENDVTTPQRDALLNLSRKRNISPEWITSGRGDMIEAESTRPGALNIDQAELLALWAQLLPREQAELIDTIKAKAEHNREARERPIEIRTVSMSERRLSNQSIHFADRRKKDA